jgi:hypothetical protein
MHRGTQTGPDYVPLSISYKMGVQGTKVHGLIGLAHFGAGRGQTGYPAGQAGLAFARGLPVQRLQEAGSGLR